MTDEAATHEITYKHVKGEDGTSFVEITMTKPSPIGGKMIVEQAVLPIDGKPYDLDALVYRRAVETVRDNG